LAAFLERRGVKKLSVALHRDPLRLAEVSLVVNPRVSSAAMFGERGDIERGSAEIRRSAEDSELTSALSAGFSALSVLRNPRCGGEVNDGMAESTSKRTSEEEIAELRFALRAKDVEAKLAELKAQGKIVPASEPYAREILLQGDGKITFGEGETTIAQLFECFLAGQPKVVIFGELAPGTKTPAAPLSAEDEEVLAKLGVTRDQVEKYAGDS
jgi:hypothetical protein